MLNAGAGVQITGIQIDVLVNNHGAVAPFRRTGKSESIVRVFEVIGSLHITRCQSRALQDNPDLQKVHWILVRCVIFAMKHTRACAHALQVTRLNDGSIAHAVLVPKRALDNIGNDFHVPVSVGIESPSWLDAVLIDNAQRAKPHMCRIVKVSEGEAVAAVEPAKVGLAALLAGA